MKKTMCLAVVLAAAGAGSGAFAQDPDDGGPGRGVARMSVINGDVSVRRGDSGDWIAAAPNAPLVVGDRIFTGPASRGEVQFDYANMIRLNDNTEIRLSELEYLRYQIQVAAGTVTFRVLRDSQAETELSTPSVSVRPVRRGEYRVTVFADGSSEITIRSGEAEIYTPRGVERLSSGRTMRARGPASDPEFQIARAIPEDDFDRWNERRDRDLNRSRSYQYVSRDIYGAEDLDAHGTWIYVPPYGWVWSPRASAGWAPYRYGRWTWIDWYGWSWVSYDPWGWAPYHYGRWFYHGSRWCWYPGPVYHRHYWRPALVAFFGWGSHGGVHVGVGFGWGHVGWVPLAPYEPYYPWYGNRYYRSYRGGDYVDNSVHVVNNTNITNIYRNARVDNGITAVNAGDFTRGRAASLVKVSGGDLRSVGLVKGVVPVAPDRESLRVADRDVNRAVLARNAENGEGRFFSRRQPAQIERASFDEQRRGVEQIARRSFGETRAGEVSARETGVRGGSEERGVRRAGEAVERRENPVAGGAEAGARTSERGWRRVGESNGRVAGQEAAGVAGSEGAAARTSERGWRRVGESTGRAAGQEGSGVAGREGGASGPATRPNDGWRRFGERSPGGEATRDPGVRSRSTERNQSAAPGVSDPGSPSRSSDGWRRFGERSPGGEATRDPGVRSRTTERNPGGDANRDPAVRGRTIERNQSTAPAAPDPGSASRSSDGWRRFGSGVAPPGRDAGSRTASSDGWRSFGALGNESSDRPGSGTRENSSRSERIGASGRASGENGWRGFGGRVSGSETRSTGSQEPVRINPPIVRERSSPRSEYRGGSEESYPMRSWDAPQRSQSGVYGPERSGAMQPRYQAPARSWGGQPPSERPSPGSFGGGARFESRPGGSFDGGASAGGGRGYGSQPRAESPSRGSYGGSFGGAVPSGGGRNSGMASGGASRGSEGRVSGRGR